MERPDLTRFIEAHKSDYATALAEIQSGRKRSHWIWYIFPQLKGLGSSSVSEYYGIADLDEAKAFLADPYLGPHLIEISTALLQIDCSDISWIMPSPDDLKLRSSMTLFSLADPQEEVFLRVLDRFYHGKPDHQTLNLLGLSDNGPYCRGSRPSAADDERILDIQDDNIESIRGRYPNGLHFVVGDTHWHHCPSHSPR